jgi:hypothetical protein
MNIKRKLARTVTMALVAASVYVGLSIGLSYFY